MIEWKVYITLKPVLCEIIFYSFYTTKVLERHGIGYILESGSALGAERHKGLVPWDDDLDIAVHEDYESVLLKEAADELCKFVSLLFGLM